MPGSGRGSQWIELILQDENGEWGVGSGRAWCLLHWLRCL